MFKKNSTIYPSSSLLIFNFTIISGTTEIDIMRDMSIVVFEVLEKAWATRNCALIDMKIEFGVQENGLFFS